MRIATLLGIWFNTWRSRGAHRKHARAQFNQLVLWICTLVALACLGWVQLHVPGANRVVLVPLGVAPSLPTPPSASTTGDEMKGAGGNVLAPTAPALCNPFDPGCVATSLSSWIATQVQNALQPVANQILQNPADILYQTPPADSYQNQVILALNTLFIGVIDVALASMLVVGAYNVMVGHHLRMLHASFSELIPRTVLVMAAVHFNQTFVGLFIDFENQLSLAVFHIVGLAMLTNIVAGIFTSPLTGLLSFILMVVLAILVFLLLIQMIMRIALVALGVAMAPLGLGCLMLPQTLRWGRLWLTLFASSVLVQLLQVVALGLGSVLITAIASTSLFRLDKVLATAFLAIGVLLLVLKIPGMLQQWALHPMMDGFGGGGGSGNGDGSGVSSDLSGSTSAGDAMWGDMGGDMAGSQVINGTIVTEESGSLLLLF
jgi:hypothetical protein